MQLKTWVDEARLRKELIAAVLGVSPMCLNLWCRGIRIPRPDAMRAIYRLTAGAVTPNDFYDLPPLADTAPAARPQNAEAA